MSHPPDLDSRRLKVFRAVCAEGSLSRAARRLHLSQPAVTACVQQLEAAVGTALLVRGVRGVEPTPAGARLLPFADAMVELLDRATAEVGERPESNEPLVLAASTTAATYLVPRHLAALRRELGDFPIELRVGNTAEVLSWVERRTVPLGLVEGKGRAPRVRLEPVLDDEILPVVAADAPRAFLRAAASRLEGATLLLREPGSGTREVVERALRRIGRKPGRLDVELGSTEAIRMGVLANLGIAFLSRLVIGAELENGRLRILEVPGLSIRRAFSLAYLGTPPSGLAGRLGDRLRAG